MRSTGKARVTVFQQATCDAGPVDRQRLVEALAQAAGGTGPLLDQRAGQGFELGAGRVGARQGGGQPPLGQRTLGFGQMIGDACVPCVEDTER